MRAIRRLAPILCAGLVGACAAAPIAEAPDFDLRPDPVLIGPPSPEAALEDAVEAALAAHRGAAPRDLSVVVEKVTEAGDQRVYEVRLQAGRGGRAYTVYASCAPERLEDCVAKVAGAAQALGRMR